MPVFLQIPENPNCDAVDGQVFACRTPPRRVSHVRLRRADARTWFDVTGLEADGAACPATACLVEDSGDGMCYLLVGGEWGLRLKMSGPWDLADHTQWGEPYMLLGGDGQDLRFVEIEA
ncbi:MAG: hypothetical protein U0Q18_06660 [Bryobacteraceae bacterium]